MYKHIQAKLADYGYDFKEVALAKRHRPVSGPPTRR